MESRLRHRGLDVHVYTLYCYPEIRADYCFRDIKSMTHNVLAFLAILISVSLCALVDSLLVLHHL